MIAGSSLSFLITFAAPYDVNRIEDLKLSVGANVLGVLSKSTITKVGQSFRCEVSSEKTYRLLSGVHKLTLSIEDSQRGVIIDNTNTFEVVSANGQMVNSSVNNGYNIEIYVTIDESIITSDIKVLEAIKGDKGDAFTYEDFTPEQLAELKGADGADGADGVVDYSLVYTKTESDQRFEPIRDEDENYVTDSEKSALHSHSNKSILDGTQESFTTSLKSDYDGKQNATDELLETESNNVVGAINEVNSISKQASRGRVFLTELALNNWLLVPENVELLNIGDSFYIVELEVPDYWWDGTQKRELETQKVDLTQYYTADQIDTLLEGYYTESEITTILSGYAPTIHNHSGQSINPDNIIIDKSYTNTQASILAVGSIFYNSDQQDWVLKTGADTYYNFGGEVSPLMKNGDSFTHLNGQPVYVSTGTGKFAVMKLANASAENTSYTIAIATQDVLSSGNARGRYCAFGSVGDVPISNIIKTGESSALWVEGAPLYLSTESGKLTTIAPIAPNHRVIIGYITDKSGANISIFVNTNVGEELGELHDVDLTKTKTTPADSDNVFLQDSADSSIWKKTPFGGLKAAIVASQNNITLESTGFRYPELTIVTGNGDRTISLSGTIEAYWRGILNTTLISGYTSPAHGTDTSKLYYLSYDGLAISWLDTVWTFDKLQIAIAKYDLTNGVWYYFRECHGLMTWQTHKEFHNTIGTYKESGGTIPTNSYAIDSTTAANRRPNIDAILINDEDLPTTNAALTSKLYSQFRLNGADLPVNTIDSADMISLSANNPYYNQSIGGIWQQTLLPANAAATVWVYALPAANDPISQKYRYLFVQPQSYTQAASVSSGAINTAVSTEKNKFSSELNLNGLISTEIVAFAKVIIVYTGGNWFIREINYISGSKITQVNQSGSTAPILAANVIVTPSGNISSTNLEATIQELDSEKVDKSQTALDKLKLGIDYANSFLGQVVSDSTLAVFTSGTGAGISRSASIPSILQASNTQGVAQFRTGSTSAGTALLISEGSIGDQLTLGGGIFLVEKKIVFGVLSTATDRYVYKFGMGRSVDLNGSAEVQFIYDEGGVKTGSSASPKFQICTSSGSVRTYKELTGLADIAINTIYTLKIIVNADATRVDFYVNGVFADFIDTNIPKYPTRCAAQTGIFKQTGTTSVNVWADYIGINQVFTTPLI